MPASEASESKDGAVSMGNVKRAAATLTLFKIYLNMELPVLVYSFI